MTTLNSFANNAKEKFSSRFKIEWLNELVETELPAATENLRKNLERYSVIVKPPTASFASCANKLVLSANSVPENAGMIGRLIT